MGNWSLSASASEPSSPPRRTSTGAPKSPRPNAAAARVSISSGPAV
ncbi:MAG: hypothetical protein M3R61_10605 [Chloroflexota bacterium]|nr:hypothetical protein [Chloroflexota bacterium]